MDKKTSRETFMSRHQIVRDTNLIKTGVDTRSPEEKKRAQQYKDSDGDRHRQLDSECDRISAHPLPPYGAYVPKG